MDKTAEEVVGIDRIEAILANNLERRRANMFENHAQTVVVFVMLGVLSWVGYSILQADDDRHKTNITLEVLKNDVSYIKAVVDKAASMYVPKTEFAISIEQITEDMKETKDRVSVLEQKIGGRK
jgi:hypothetical protein